jgi:hypothetical protein
MLELLPNGTHRTIDIGSDIAAGQQVQHTVARGLWQGSFLLPEGGWALMGATVAPGFEYADYEAGERQRLIQRYPAAAELIVRLTPGA